MAGIPRAGPYYINDASILIPVGNRVIQQSLDTGERSFLLSSRIRTHAGDVRHLSLTAFSVSSDGALLAMGSTLHNEPPVLIVYSLPDGQPLAQFSFEMTLSIHFVCFNRAGKLGMMLISDPRRLRLSIFSMVSKSEVQCVRASELYETGSFNPGRDDQVILFSPKALGFYNFSDEAATLIPVPNYSKFTGFVYSMCDPSITCAASGRDLLLFQDFQLKHTFSIGEDSSIVFLTTFAHGFIITTANFKISFIQHVPGFREIGRSFHQGATLGYGIEHPIVWSAFSPSGHQMVCNVDNRHLLIVNTREFESSTENSIIDPKIVSHKGPVASISSCAYKPMFVSCGLEDQTVIVWDYAKQTAVLHSEFAESLTDVSFHPSGDLIAVATSEKLYLLAATVDNLVNRAQWPLFNCLSIEFSNGGHFLVAASHIITFINPYTQEIIATLRGHSGLIRSLSWSPDDKRLVSSGSDGNIIEWNAVTQQQTWSVTIAKADFESSIITDRGTVIACSRGECLYHVFMGRHQANISDEKIGFSAALFVSPTCVILGDVLGEIAVVQWPFVLPAEHKAEFDGVPQLEFSDSIDKTLKEGAVPLRPIPFQIDETFRTHCGKVTSLCSSLDGRVLFSSSSDSSICVFNVLGPNQVFPPSAAPILRCDIPKQQFFLVSQSRFDELQHAIEKLKKDIQKQRITYEASTIESLQAHQKTMMQFTEHHEEKKSKLNQQLESLKEAMDESTIKAALIYQNMEMAHLNEAKALTNLYEQKLALELSKGEQIAKEVDDLKCAYEERIYLLKEQYKASLQEFTEKVNREQTQLNETFETTKTRIHNSQESQDRLLTELELEFDHDRMRINLEYHTRLTALDKQLKELTQKKEKLKADTQKQEAEITELKAELGRLNEKRNELDKEIKGLQHTLECRTSELNDRDETLLRQAERLGRLQSSNSELEKNKTIMDYRLAEMRQELVPSTDEIARLEAELEGNKNEIETIERFEKANRRTMHDKGQQIELLRERLNQKKAILFKKQRVIQMLTVDLTEGVARTDPVGKAGIIKELHDKYVAAQDLEDSLKNANETIHEHTRQRKHLQQSVMLLQSQVHQHQEITAKHLTTKAAENSVLLNDLNRLQRENRLLRKKVENTRSDVEMLESNLRRVRQATQERQIQQARVARWQQAVPHHVVGDWVKEKSRTGVMSSVSVVDSRGKFLPGALTKT
jgi:WD40 repeat protein/predicted  nucleic acid-binding Zn-ribbon protein